MGKKFQGSSFGEYLKKSRVEAGFSSLDRAIAALRSRDPAHVMSKAMLNLMERGLVQFIKPETLHALGRLYGVPYSELSVRWFSDQFKLSIDDIVATHSFVREVGGDSVVLQEAGEEGARIEVISIERLKQLQSELPARSSVYVSAVRFLDDGPYYEMVKANVRKGVSYHYSLPESEHSTYLAFVSRLEKDLTSLRGKIDGRLTHFSPRMNLEAPTNYAIFERPDKTVHGFVGLLYNDLVRFLLVADTKLSWRLLEGFRWAREVASNEEVRIKLSQLSATIAARQALKGSGSG